MDDFDRKILEGINKGNLLRNKDGLSEPEDPNKLSRTRILAMVEGSPHDFENFDINSLEEEDFKMERRYQSNELTETELSARQQDLDLDHPLKEGQKELIAYLINRMMERHRL